MLFLFVIDLHVGQMSTNLSYLQSTGTPMLIDGRNDLNISIDTHHTNGKTECLVWEYRSRGNIILQHVDRENGPHYTKYLQAV